MYDLKQKVFRTVIFMAFMCIVYHKSSNNKWTEFFAKQVDDKLFVSDLEYTTFQVHLPSLVFTFGDRIYRNRLDLLEFGHKLLKILNYFEFRLIKVD